MNTSMKTFGLMILVAVAYAAQTTYKLIVNGQNAGQAIVVNGQTYVPLAALRPLGISSSLSGGTLTLGNTQGGSNPLTALEGCLGQTLFNGIWRAKVTKVEAIDANGQKGYGVTLELRNATSQSLSPSDTNVKFDQGDIALALDDGSTLNMNRYDYAWLLEAIPQAAPKVHVVQFFTDSSAKPSKLIVRIEPIAKDSRLSVRYTAADPSFRFNLACQK